jgi:SAM-dependent methyltransferase
VGTPATWGWKRRLADVMARVRLLGPAVSLYQTALAVRGTVGGRLAPRRALRADDGLAIPPAQLRVRIGPSFGDVRTFLESGRRHAQLVESVVLEHGSSPEASRPMLDFGCGCGRVARHWSGRDVALHGCDVNRRMVGWCRKNLPFGRFEANDLAPPLSYGNHSFGLMYAFSVLTHLPEQLQHDWLAEFRRVLRPGGYLFFSTLGEYYAGLGRLNADERRKFDAGQLVVLFEDSAGESFCSAYHPPSYVARSLATGFEYVHHRSGDDRENHDMHLFRKLPVAS